MNNKKSSRFFLLFLVVAILVACYFVFRIFLIDILVAAVLVSILYRPYKWLAKILGGRKQIAAFLMCLLAVALIIVPLSQLVIYSAKKSIVAYSQAVDYFGTNGDLIQSRYLNKLSLTGFDSSSLHNFVLDVMRNSSNFIVNAAATIVKGTTNFFMSLILIIFTMFFFFVDGKRMVHKLAYWSPLPNEYDQKLFKKFREVSYSTIISTFVVVTAQGIIGGIGYAIIGLPAFFAGLLIAICSLIPIVGSIIIYVPTAIYLLAIGQTWQGIFLLLWGFLVIGTIDNVLRTVMIKGKAHVNPIFVFFSILGGVALFGFWGVVLGPLIVSLAITIMHLYELEFSAQLEKPKFSDGEEGKSEKKEK